MPGRAGLQPRRQELPSPRLRLPSPPGRGVGGEEGGTSTGGVKTPPFRCCFGCGRRARCAVCGGELRNTAITHEEKRGTKLYLFQNVPAQVCSACGEIWIEEAALQEIDRLIRKGEPTGKIETPRLRLRRLQHPLTKQGIIPDELPLSQIRFAASYSSGEVRPPLRLAM